MADNSYKIQLGVDLKVNDIRDRITQYNKNTNNAKLKLGIKLDTDDLKQQINKLNLGGTGKGKGVAIPVNTQSLENSLKEVKGIIADIKASMGTLDGGNMKSLLSSVNQIATALGKAENESDNLVKSLNALSKKDFNINLGIDMNKKGLNTIGYGRAARKQVIPELESQIKYLENLFGGQQATMNKLASKGRNVGFDVFTDFGDFNSESAIKKMEAMEKYINSLKKLAAIDNVNLDGFNEIHKDASVLINDITGIENAVDKAGDVPEKLKNLFGGSIDGEGLSKQLDSIVVDLGEIKTVIQGISSGVSLEGLTQSFDRLSDSIEQLVKNCTTAKQVINDSVGNLGGSAGQSGNGIRNINNDLKQVTITADNTADAIDSMKNAMSSMKFNTSSIDAATKDLEEMNIVIKEVTAKQGKNFDITVKGVNDVGEAVNVVKRFNAETGNFDIIGTKISKPFNEGAEAAKRFKKEAELANNIKVDIELGNYDNQMSQMYERFNKLSSASDDLRNTLSSLESAYRELELANESGDKERLIQAEKEYAAALEKTNNLIRMQTREQRAQEAAEKLAQDKASIKLNTANWLKENTKAIDLYGDELKRLIALLDKAEDQVTKNQIATQINNVKKIAKSTGHTGLNLWDKLINKVKEYSSYLSAAELFMYAEQALRSMFEQVKLIDSAMTELKKVTNESDAAYNQFLTNAAKRSREIGTTIDGLVSSTADFARLGYGFEDAQGLAEVANIYAVVGDEIEGVEGATESLISTMAAFKDDFSGLSNGDSAMRIVDIFNELGNNFAISSGGLGEAFERSASSLAAANNSIYESAALITAANTVVQDPATVGQAFKTISMRIRGAKTELEEMGEDTSGMVDSTAKLREEIMALSGVDIMASATEFKSTYQIMDELAAKWKDLTDIQQASITELIAGKRQGNIVSSLMTNFDTARQALETSINSSGSALEEHEKWSQSIEARLNKLKAAWQGLSQAFLNSDFLKGLLDVVTGVVDALEWIVDKFGLLGTLGLGVGITSFLKPFLNGGKIKKTISDVVGSVDDLADVIAKAVSAGSEFAETGANITSAATEAAEATTNMASATTETVESATNLTSAVTETAEATTNITSAATEATEATANLASASTEAAEAMGNMASAGSEVVEATTNIASAGSEAAETVTNIASASSELAETGANAASAGSEILEAGTNIASAGTEAVEAGANIASTGSEMWEVGANLASSGVTLAAVWAKFGNVIKPIFKTIGTKLLPLLKGAGWIGLATAGVSLVYNIIKKTKEEAAKLRAETIEASDAFLDSTSSFEQAYIKYSGKTNLTVEEEADLKSAIDGTVEALGDKSSALKGVVKNSNDYVASLERIADAELKAAKKAAKDKRDAAEGDLKEAAIGWTKQDGAEVNVEISSGANSSSAEEAKIADEVGKKYRGQTSTGSGVTTTEWLELPANADLNQILDYYYMLLEYQERLESEGYKSSEAYKNTTNAIKKMSSSIEAYTDGVYEAAKAEYKLAEGIPKTAEEYMAMRKNILNSEDVKGKSINYKMAIANMADEEYSKIFDLTSAEIQARKFVGIIKKYGDGTKDGTNDIGKVETFLNLRTSFNNNECSVSDYLSGLDEINEMTKQYSKEERKAFNLEFGIDTDAVKEQYENMQNFLLREANLNPDEYTKLSRKDAEAYDKTKAEIEEFLGSLTSSELAAVVDIRTEIDWDNTSIEDIRKQIEDQVKFNEAMNYTISIDVEAEGIEALNTAMAESVSATGLSSESIETLKSRYAELASQGYDLSAMFEETSNGIHLNRDAISEFEQIVASKKLTEADGHLEVLKGRYDELSDEIKNCGDASERAKLYSDQQDIVKQINNLATLTSQYEGLTSAYNAWQNAESSGSERDMYESIIEGFETVGDEISRGWYDDGTIKFLELITGETDLAGKSASELKKIWNSLDDTIKGTSYSVKDFFTTDEDGNSTSTGAYNFLRAVEELGKNGGLKALKGKNIEDLIVRNDKGKIVEFDFDVVGGDEAIAKALGISEEMVQIIQRTLDDAGFVVTLDGKYTLLADLKNSAEIANDTLKKLKSEGIEELKGVKDVDLNFDFNVDTVEGYQEQLEKATNVLDKFRDKNGKLKTDKNGNLVKGAKEALEIAQYYTAAMDKLTEPKFMQLDTSTIEDEKIQNAIEDMQEIGELCKEKHQVSLTGDTEDLEEVQEKINKVAKELEQLDDDTKKEIGIELDWTSEDIANAIEKGEIEIPAELQLDVQMSEDLKDIRLLMLESLGHVTHDEVSLKLGYEIDDSTVNKLIKDGKQEVVLEFLSDKKNEEWFKTLSDDKKEIVVNLISNGIDLKSLDTEDRKIVVDFAAKNKDVWDKLSGEEQSIAVKFITENSDKEWFKKLSKGEQKVALEIIDSGVDLSSLEDGEKEIAIKYVSENANWFEGLKDSEKEIAIKYVVENKDYIEKLSEKEQAIYVKYIAKGENLDELTKKEREVLVKLVAEDSEWFNKLSEEEKKIAIKLAIENKDEFDNLTDEKKEVVIKYVSEHKDFFDELSNEQREVAIKLVAENKDEFDKLTDEKKKVFIEYVIKNEKKFNELSESDKKVFVNYIANGGDVDKFDAELKKRNRNIEIIAETHGVEDIEGLKSAMSGLTDEQVKAIAEAIGKGDVDALDSAVEGMDGNTVKAIANALGYDDVESLKSSIRGMQGKEVPAAVNTDGQSEKIDTLQSSIWGLDGTTVDVVVNFIKSGWESVKNWVTGGNKKSGKKGKKGKSGGSPVNGTANVDGTIGRAFKQGSWGTKGSGTALVGELGREVLVRDGKYYTIGDNGAEFIRYKKGDIIFNHVQSDELFKNGRVTSGNGRAKALVGGTAFLTGTAFGSGTGGGEEPDTITVGVNSNTGKSYTKSKDNDDFEETIDLIETALKRVQREIDNLDQKANRTYKSWSSRNKALISEIGKVEDEINLQQKAYKEYMAAANGVGLSSSWKKKVQKGEVDIETVKDEALADKIKDYETYYEKALGCKDAIEDLKDAEAELYMQRFENVQAQYDGILQGYEHTETMLNEYISQAEAQGHIISKKYYQALINNEKSNISQLKKEQSALIAARDKAVADGAITKYSEEWYNMCAEIDGVTQAIEEGTTALIEYDNAMRDIDWEKFDLTQERISDVTAESDFLIDLMSNKDLHDDKGNLTAQGAATMGLHGLNYNTHMYQVDDYGKEIANLDKEIAKDPYDQELINRRRELIELQRESILAAEDEKQAIKDLVQDGIDKELDSLQELIDKKNEALESEKDLYEYQKKVKEQTEEIASLEKQMAAYENDDSEEAKAKIQELRVSLEDAKENLKETEWDKYIQDTSVLLDTLYTEYETVLNTRLNNVDDLLNQVVTGINTAMGEGGTITTALGSEGAIAMAIANTVSENGGMKSILNSELGTVGTTLSTAMNNIWSVGEGNAKSILTMYGADFQGKLTTVNETLAGIKANTNKEEKAADKEADKKIKQNKTSTSAKKDPTKDDATKKKTTTTKKKTTTKKSSGDGKAKVGDKVKFVSGKYYYDSQGKKPLGSQNKGKQVYITSINTASWATHPYHISTGKKLGSGDLGWLKLSQLSGYATGKKKISNSEYAWTQENGQEFIIRPSDGAILTPVAKGDSVLNAAASGNIWQMANNPAEFIKDNLGLGSSNIPNGANVQSSYSQTIENVTFDFKNVKNYEEMLSAMQKDKNFERLILSMSIDRLAGKSGLAKGKSIR